MDVRPILLVDGLNLFIRHFVSNPAMNASGESMGGVVGFLKNLQFLVDRSKPTRVIVVWEGGGSRRKRAIFKDYKSQRKAERLNRYYADDIPNTVENRNQQLLLLTSILKDLPVCQVYVADCEADDVIGYLARYQFREAAKLILSSDKDFYQLIDAKTQIYSPTSKSFIKEQDVLSRFGIAAKNFCVAKALNGDPSDNIPGIQGVGFKTLAKRFPQLGSEREVLLSEIVEESRARRDIKRSPKVFTAISDAEETIARNWKLMYLDVQNLSASQVKQIEHVVSTHVSRMDKMGVLRKLVHEGIDSVNADSLFYACACLLKV